MEKENDVKKNVIKPSCHPARLLCGVFRLYRRLSHKANNRLCNKQLISGRCRIAAFRHDSPLCNAAFTLMELLVVVLIIGILAAVALPQYEKAVMKTRYANLKNLTNSIAQAQTLYSLETGTYANDFEDLVIDMPGGKLNSSTSNKYIYTWGHCSLATDEEGYGLVFCKNSTIKMEYHIQLKHLGNNPNGRVGKRCVVLGSLDLSDPRNQLCKRETGAASYDASLAANGNAHWWY